MDKKNILIFSYQLAVGGSELNALKLSKLLRHNFYWLTIYRKKNNYYSKSKSISKFYNCGLDIDTKKTSIINFIMFIFTLNKVLKKENIHTIYAIGFLPSIISCFVKFFSKINLITTRRGADKAGDKKYFVLNFIINLFSNTIETNSRNIFNNNRNKFLIKNKIKLVNNIIPDYLIQKKKKIFKKDRLIVGIISNLRPVKNPEMLKSIVEFLCKEKKNIFFYIVGRDFNSNYKYIKKKYKNKIVWKTFIPNEKIKKFYNSVDVLLITSLFESSPNVILEAFANGVPVVSTPNDGSKKLIKNNFNGLISKDFKVKNLISCLTKVLKFRKEYSKNSKRTFLDNYNFEKNINKINSYF